MGFFGNFLMLGNAVSKASQESKKGYYNLGGNRKNKGSLHRLGRSHHEFPQNCLKKTPISVTSITQSTLLSGYIRYMKEFWDARYQEDGFAYGHEANVFIRESLEMTQRIGKVLFPAEGEGRNAVFAAQKNWEVEAYDISESGKLKADNWARENGVSIHYQIGGFLDIEYPESQFDALVFSYVHMPSSLKSLVFERHMPWMKPDALIVFEGFSVNNLPYRAANPQVGGPDNIDMLYSVNEVQELLKPFNNLRVWEEEVTLSEGKYHIGKAKVIRARNF